MVSRGQDLNFMCHWSHSSACWASGLQCWLRTNWRVIAAPSIPCNAAEVGGGALCRADAEFPDLGKIIFADTVRDGSMSVVSVCALYNLGSAAGMQRLLCLFSLNSLILGVGMLPEEEMGICGPSQG